MNKSVILIIVFLITISVNAQEYMKKIQLKEGAASSIQYNDLSIDALLQVYDGKSAAHLIGDVNLRVDNNGEAIAEFYIDNNKSAKAYYTKVYKNYFLTFKDENNSKYLIIEQAQFGKAFALSSKRSSTIRNNDDLVEIEITDYIYERGYNGLPEEDNSKQYDDVKYTLKVKVNDIVKSFSFYSSQVKGNFTIDLGAYYIQTLSDVYSDSLSLIEMIINKKSK